MTVRVFVEQHPNEDIRDFHVSKPITAKPFSKYDTKGVPKKVKRLEAAIARCPETARSLSSDVVDHKSLRMERNKAYSWDETISAVIEVLRRFYRDDIDLTVGERNPEWDRPRPERNGDWDY